MKRWQCWMFVVGLCGCAVAPAAELAAAATRNPFGVLFGVNATSEQRIALAQKLGVAWYRPTGVRLDQAGECPDCAAAQTAGLRLALLVKAGGDNSKASVAPEDLKRFQEALTKTIERYHPALLVVENEPDSRVFYQGTAQEYLIELAAACEVAHRTQIPCTDGGIVSMLSAALVAQDWSNHNRERDAQRLLHEAMRSPVQEAKGDMPEAGARKRRSDKVANEPHPLEREAMQQQLAFAAELLAGVKKVGADYVNFHWLTNDVEAFRAAVVLLRERSGLPVVATEIGQHVDTPATTVNLMRATRAAGLSVAIWSGVDAAPRAYGLADESGNFTPRGEAFRRELAGHH